MARVQPLDQVLDIGLRVLRMHQARDRTLQLPPVHDDRRVHREMIVLAGMIDVCVRMTDVPHVPDLDAVFGKLVLDHVLVVLQPAHPERFHDRVVAIAGIDDDRIAATDDQEAVHRHPFGPSTSATEHEKARFELDIAEVEHLDFQRHPSGSLCHSRYTRLAVS